MKKRKPEPIGEPYHILRLKMDGNPYTVYLCRNCQRGWRLPEPVENWRIKTLLSHSATHRIDAQIEAFLGTDAEETAFKSRQLKLEIPKKRRRKRKSAEQKVSQ